jgi:hypothetical protein
VTWPSVQRIGVSCSKKLTYLNIGNNNTRNLQVKLFCNVIFATPDHFVTVPLPSEQFEAALAAPAQASYFSN